MRVPAALAGSPRPLVDHWCALARALDLLDGCVLSFSGGADSALLLAVGVPVLGDGLLAVIVDSPSLPGGELDAARDLATSLGARLEILQGSELDDEDYASNPPERCFYCKRRILAALDDVRRREGLAAIVDGTNADDLGADRPGRRAAIEAGVISPLADAGLTKPDVRELSRALHLPTAGKPSLACLASRIPHGRRITSEALAVVDEAEQSVRGLGFDVVRVRHHGDVARVEVGRSELDVAFARREEIGEACRSAGFSRAELDPDGYRGPG
jgi:pyridinium-3,5-biscarboxylic acid mononucleotide sulfurtransferase